MAAVSPLGLIITVAGLVFNGSFNIFGKLCKKDPDPVIFNSLLCIGAALSSFLTIPFFPLINHASGPYPLGFTLFGFAAGGLLVFATLFTFAAIPFLGVAKGTPCWCSIAILTAFLWGSVGPSDPGPADKLKNMHLSIVALVLIIIGAVTITLAPIIKDKFQCGIKVTNEFLKKMRTVGSGIVFGQDVECNVSSVCDGDPTLDAKPISSSTSATSPPGHSSATTERGALATLKRYPCAGASEMALGIVFAAMSGICGGSILVPASYVDPKIKGLPLAPSFGAGAGSLGLLTGLLYWTLFRRESLSMRCGSRLREELHCEVVWKGIASGFIWNAGNLCLVITMDSLGMPYGIATPIYQCAFLISGLWGIYYFKEVTDCMTIVIFWTGIVVLISSVLVLGLYGPGA